MQRTYRVVNSVFIGSLDLEYSFMYVFETVSFPVAYCRSSSIRIVVKDFVVVVICLALCLCVNATRIQGFASEYLKRGLSGSMACLGLLWVVYKKPHDMRIDICRKKRQHKVMLCLAHIMETAQGRMYTSDPVSYYAE